ncbi:MAG: transposase [Planctomycetia bacterium]|nr:transposase [Planctomycetia bacterium]
MGPLYSCSKKAVPHVKIVFDLFHVVSGFGKVIDKVRNAESKASKEDKDVFRVQNIFC